MYKLTLCFEKLGTACRFIDAMNDADFTKITITKEKSETAAGNEDGDLAITDTDIVSENKKPVKDYRTNKAGRDAEIFSFYNAGWSVEKIADEVGLSVKRVYQILKKFKEEISGQPEVIKKEDSYDIV